MPWSLLGWRKGVNKKDSQINSIENIFIETPETANSHHHKFLKNVKVNDQKAADTCSLSDFRLDHQTERINKPLNRLSKFFLKHNTSIKQLDLKNCCDDTTDSSSTESTKLSSNSKIKERLKSFTKADSLPVLNDISVEKNVKLTDELCKFFADKSIEWKEYSNNLVDSHCHIEMLFYKYSYFFFKFLFISNYFYYFRIKYDKSLDKYFQEYSDIYLKNFEFCINVICDPYKYNKFSKSIT